MKKIFMSLIIFLACVLVFALGMGVVVMIAPGVNMFGVEYIRSTLDAKTISKSVQNADAKCENIIVNSHEIDVNVNFVQSHTLTAEYIHNYRGFANEPKEPELKLESANKDIVISTVEYDKFLLGGHVNENCCLNINVPMYYKGSITIISEKSDVIVKGHNASINNLSIKTNGTPEIKSNLIVNTLSLNTTYKIVNLNENVKVNKNLIFDVTGGSFTVANPVGGDIYYKSNSGTLNFVSCNDLNFSSQSGKIIANINQVAPIVLGNCNIKTSGDITLASVGKDANIENKNGDIKIGSVDGLYSGNYLLTSSRGDCTLIGTFLSSVNLETKSGNLNADNIADLTFKTKRGALILNSCEVLLVEAGIGDIKVSNILADAKISATSGKIDLGLEDYDSIIANCKVVTKSGDVDICDIQGALYDIQTRSGDIELENNYKAIATISLKSRTGSIEADLVNGITNIESRGEIKVSVYDFNGAVSIVGNNKDVKVKVLKDGFYDLESVKKNIEKAPGLGIVSKKYKTSTSTTDPNKILKVYTKWGGIEVYRG